MSHAWILKERPPQEEKRSSLAPSLASQFRLFLQAVSEQASPSQKPLPRPHQRGLELGSIVGGVLQSAMSCYDVTALQTGVAIKQVVNAYK